MKVSNLTASTGEARRTTASVPCIRSAVSVAAISLRLDRMARGAHRGAHDLDMRAAAAQIVAQRFQHLGFGRMRRAQQQRLGGDDHAVQAVAALRGLFVR